MKPTTRWETLRYHPEQSRLWTSGARFKVVPAGRRSGKTEICKRIVARVAMFSTGDQRYFLAAPTREQAKAIFWEDLKKMVPPWMVAKKSETSLWVRLLHGPEVWVVGLDKPERVEGRPWDGAVIDECSNVKPDAWEKNIRPALADRRGWCVFPGVPEGRNHYYDLAERGRSEDHPDWELFHWISADILDPDEIRSAKEDLDEDIYAQEFEASFVSFRGRAYRGFRESNKARLEYRPRAPLIFCFDFNVDPGVAVVCQEMRMASGLVVTGVIGEVHIPYDSDTEAVCERLIYDWSGHSGEVYLYGDPTGGNRGTAKLQGSDWDIVMSSLSRHFRLRNMVAARPPAERFRVGCLNSRIRSKSQVVRLLVDPSRAPYTVRDLEGVKRREGGTGEVDKKDKRLTHLSDALGYYVVEAFPVIETARAGAEKLTIG